MTQTYTYYQAARCHCGFIWTTSADHAVICLCGDTGIANGIISGTPEAYQVSELEEAVSNLTGIPLADLLLVEGE